MRQYTYRFCYSTKTQPNKEISYNAFSMKSASKKFKKNCHYVKLHYALNMDNGIMCLYL